MAIEIKVPSVGESVSKGVLASWLKGNGETVREGEDVLELETEKATMAVPAPASGVLEIRVQAGQEVTVGQVVGAVEAAPEQPAGEPAPPRQEQAAPAQRPAVEPTAPAAAPSPAPAAPAGEPALSPAVRRLAGEYGLDPLRLRGTGHNGRVTREDVLRAAQDRPPAERPAAPAAPASPASPAAPAAPATPAAAVPGRPERRMPLTPLRKRIAENLVRARQSAAHLTTFNEIDLQEVANVRSHYREEFEREHGVRIGFMPFFVKACCQALKEFPEVNTRLEGDELVYQDYYDIGVAVSTERGLLVPVLRGADRMSFAEIEKAIASLAGRAREKKITPDELVGGTFTITNGGVFGSLLSTPIPNYPQTAILGMHIVQKRPVVVADQIVIRPMMYVALTYDHRVIDGREAVGFLARVKQYVEDPRRLLLNL